MGSLLQGIFWAYSKPIRNILGIFMAFLRYVCGWFRCAPCRWRISAPGRSPSAELCWRWWRFACWRHLAVATTEVSEDVRTNGKRWPCEHMITHAYVFICLQYVFIFQNCRGGLMMIYSYLFSPGADFAGRHWVAIVRILGGFLGG